MIRAPIATNKRSTSSNEHETLELPFPKLSPMALPNITAPTAAYTPSSIYTNGYPFPHIDSGFYLPSLKSISSQSHSISLPPLKSILTPPLPTAAASPELSPSAQTPTAKPCYHYGDDEEATDSMFTEFMRPLTLAERRQRNKTASARYRAKKQLQNHEMKSMIQDLTDQNGLLTKQLEEAKRENTQLRRVCDQLRAQIVADNMLKRYFRNGVDLEDLDEVAELGNKRSMKEHDNSNGTCEL